MIINTISIILIACGTVLALLELFLTINLFKYSGSVGIGLLLLGVFILSYKESKKKIDVRKKDLGRYNDVGGQGGD